jgi:hypothetical protein
MKLVDLAIVKSLILITQMFGNQRFINSLKKTMQQFCCQHSRLADRQVSTSLLFIHIYIKMQLMQPSKKL